MTQDIHDDGFHEIQFNGKQLVFLFMAATVVSVVIFLCGVLVGRGVRAERASAVDTAAANAVAEPIPQQPAPPPTAPAAESDPTKAPQAPAPPAEELGPFGTVEKLPPEQKTAASANSPATAKVLAPAAEKPAEKSVEKPAQKLAPKPAERIAERPLATIGATTSPAHDARPAAAEPNGQGFAVQIAALNIRSEAEAIAKKLTSKGYTAYVLTPASGTPSVFRVRVGKFPTRREAESIAAKLQKEEQFKPWVTR